MRSFLKDWSSPDFSTQSNPRTSSPADWRHEHSSWPMALSHSWSPAAMKREFFSTQVHFWVLKVERSLGYTAYLSTIDFTTRFKTSDSKEDKTETGTNNFSPVTWSFLAGYYYF